MHRDQLENPVLGYVVVAVAVVACLVSATVLGEPPDRKRRAASGGERSVLDPSDVPAPDKRAGSLPRRTVAAPSRHAAVPAREVSFRHDSSRSASPPADSIPRRWVLGTRTARSDVGCVVTELIEFSPAEKAGIRVGDRIVAVAGQPVGWVEGNEFPLYEAVQRQPQRNTRLLIQRSGSGELKRISVRLETLAESLGH